jgi:hypothetical protein
MPRVRTDSSDGGRTEKAIVALCTSYGFLVLVLRSSSLSCTAFVGSLSSSFLYARLRFYFNLGLGSLRCQIV